ncbi:hypothetical protein LCGC14_0909230 [marine sediment metagenome]|uniref:NAD/GMP synthase domain-containing protein n=1 Tax=marine sediment metagenome TaxID=412755 RepID=A0A0F9NU47_9ZZZZ
MQDVWNTLVQKTREFVRQAGFHRVTLGLSGGIDSAVVACIAREALGAQNVLAVMMPSPYSSRGSVDDSRALAAQWDFRVVMVPIGVLMITFDDDLSAVFGHEEPRPITKENLQARIRMVLLMAICNEQDRLLLNTCNKSEDYVGYCTLYGDNAGAVAPIGGLYKTEVYSLARWINQNDQLPSIPINIIDKPPSAELSATQLDTDDLPPYEVLDPILRMFIDENKSGHEIVQAGYDVDIVKKIVRLVLLSEFKRKQSPPVIELL